MGLWLAAREDTGTSVLCLPGTDLANNLNEPRSVHGQSFPEGAQLCRLLASASWDAQQRPPLVRAVWPTELHDHTKVCCSQPLCLWSFILAAIRHPTPRPQRRFPCHSANTSIL